MGFLDKLSKTASDVGQKGKEVANIAKLKHQISEEEKNILKIYEDIGRQYFALHGQDEECEFKDEVLAITESCAKIDSCKDEINALQGVDRCPRCGEEMPADSAFCPKCGAKIDDD